MYFQTLLRTVETVCIWSFLLDGQMGTLIRAMILKEKSLRRGSIIG